MGIVLRLVVVWVVLSGLHEFAWAEEDEWGAEEESRRVTGAVQVPELPPPTAGALDSTPEPSVDPSSEGEPPPAAVGTLSNEEEEDTATTEESAEASEIELYTTSWCGYCRKAREFLHARGIPFIEYDIEQDADAAQRKLDLNGGPGVPVAVINGHVVIGFSASLYTTALQTVR